VLFHDSIFEIKFVSGTRVVKNSTFKLKNFESQKKLGNDIVTCRGCASFIDGFWIG
jgi:hypothetical protein